MTATLDFHITEGFLISIWKHLSDGQGAVIAAGLSGLLTILAATLGVLLGRQMLGGKISDIEDAIEESSKLLEEHLHQVDVALSRVKEKTEELDSVLAALSEQVGKIASGGVASDLFLTFPPSAAAERECDLSSCTDRPQVPHKSDIRDLWQKVRDYLEAVANDPKIDGRMRAKYMRVDRRSYENLITILQHDGYLSEMQARAARAADEMWNSFKPRSIKDAPPSVDEIERMTEFVKSATLT